MNVRLPFDLNPYSMMFLAVRDILLKIVYSIFFGGYTCRLIPLVIRWKAHTIQPKATVFLVEFGPILWRVVVLKQKLAAFKVFKEPRFSLSYVSHK